MTDQEIEAESPDTALLNRVAQMEKERAEIHQRLIHSEMKVEAIRAGMVDLDGLKLLDMTDIRLADDGTLAGAAERIGQMKTAKPWLFAAPSSSSIARVPPAKSARQKMAAEMTDEEYRTARANLVRHSGY